MSDDWIVGVSVVMEYLILMVPVRHCICELYNIKGNVGRVKNWVASYSLWEWKKILHPWILWIYGFYLSTGMMMWMMHWIVSRTHISRKGFEHAFVLHFGFLFSIGVFACMVGMYLDGKKQGERDAFFHRMITLLAYIGFALLYALAMGMALANWVR